jgi:hypothetical protein
LRPCVRAVTASGYGWRPVSHPTYSGFFMFAAPGFRAIVIARRLGIYVFIFGLLMLGLAFRLRRRVRARVHNLFEFEVNVR